MTNEFQAGKLILSQIGMFNEAVILHGTVVQPALLSAIEECVEKFAKAEQWVGLFDLADQKDCWLAPAQWNFGEKNSKARFQVEVIDDELDNSWCALLCNQASKGEAGFMFCVDGGTFGTQRAWNRSFSEIDEAAIADLKKLDFKIVDNPKNHKKTFFLPIHLDAVTLAETWGLYGKFSHVDPCFEPVKAALEKVKSALRSFDVILNSCPVKPLPNITA